MSDSQVAGLYGEPGLYRRMLRSVERMGSHSARSRDGTVAVEEARMQEQRALPLPDPELRHRRTWLLQSNKGLVSHRRSSVALMLSKRSSPVHSTVTALITGSLQKAPGL